MSKLEEYCQGMDQARSHRLIIIVMFMMEQFIKSFSETIRMRLIRAKFFHCALIPMVYQCVISQKNQYGQLC